MHRARTQVGGPGLAAKVPVLTRVEIPLYSVAFPEPVVGRLVRRRLVKRPQAGIKRLVVPQVKELGGAAAQWLWVEVEIFDRRAEGVFELGNVAIDFHVLRRAGGQAADARSELGARRSGAGQDK